MYRKVLKTIAYSITIFCVVLIIYFAFKNNNFKDFDPSDIKSILKGYGSLGPVIFILMFTFIPLTLFPDSILVMAPGLTFGLFWGIIYSAIGAMCGATLSFFLSRFLGKEAIKKLIKKEINIASLNKSKNGFLAILILRFVPLVPFDIISYGAGLSKVKYKDFITATFLGMLPGVIVYVNIGDKSTRILSFDFFMAIAFLGLLLGLSMFLKKKLQGKERMQGN